MLEGLEVRRTAEQAGADLQPHIRHQLLEIFVGFTFVFHQRVLLAVAAQTDALAEILHLGEVLLPMVVDRIDDHIPLQ